MHQFFLNVASVHKLLGALAELFDFDLYSAILEFDWAAHCAVLRFHTRSQNFVLP